MEELTIQLMSIEPQQSPTGAQAKQLLRRLAWLLLRIFISLLIAGALFLGLIELGCASLNGCQDTEGLAVAVVAFVITAVAWGASMSAYAAFLNRKNARIAVVLGALALTIAVWIAGLMVQ